MRPKGDGRRTSIIRLKEGGHAMCSLSSLAGSASGWLLERREKWVQHGARK